MVIPHNVKVVEFLDENEGWNWAKIKLLFSKDVLERILACHPL